MLIMLLFRKTACIASALLFLATAISALAQDIAQPKLPAVRLNAGIHNIQAEVAQSFEQRAAGLMFRKNMNANEGMLFVFEQAATQCFWMKNTLLPLSIAFITDNGTIVNLADMTPQSTASHCSSQPVRLALEMNQGWFKKHGIRAGDKLHGAPFGN